MSQLSVRLGINCFAAAILVAIVNSACSRVLIETPLYIPAPLEPLDTVPPPITTSTPFRPSTTPLPTHPPSLTPSLTPTQIRTPAPVVDTVQPGEILFVRPGELNELGRYSEVATLWAVRPDGTNERLITEYMPDEGTFGRGAISPDGYYYALSDSGRVVLVDLWQGEKIVLEEARHYRDFVWSTDGQSLHYYASPELDGESLRRVDMHDGVPSDPQPVTVSSDSGVLDCVFSNDRFLWYAGGTRYFGNLSIGVSGPQMRITTDITDRPVLRGLTPDGKTVLFQQDNAGDRIGHWERDLYMGQLTDSGQIIDSVAVVKTDLEFAIERYETPFFIPDTLDLIAIHHNSWHIKHWQWESSPETLLRLSGNPGELYEQTTLVPPPEEPAAHDEFTSKIYRLTLYGQRRAVVALNVHRPDSMPELWLISLDGNEPPVYLASGLYHSVVPPEWDTNSPGQCRLATPPPI